MNEVLYAQKLMKKAEQWKRKTTRSGRGKNTIGFWTVL